MLNYLHSLITDYFVIIVVNLIFSTIIISLERRNPTAALAWLFFMTFLPGIGFIFFMMLSQNISKRKIFKYTEKEEELYRSFIGNQIESIKEKKYHFNKPIIENHIDKILFHLRLSESFYSQNNKVAIFTDGHELFERMFDDLKQAQECIHVLFYIVRGDALAQRLFTLLEEKASAGIEVRLLVDYVGARSMKRDQIKSLENAGVQVAFFFPSRFGLFNTKANYRNHRKIVTIDSEIGYVGGFNVGTEYLGENKKFGYWRDTHLRITGDAIISLQLRFVLDWRNASHQKLEISNRYIKEAKPHLGSGMQIVCSGPDDENEQIKQGFVKMIHSARDYVYIQSPYFIPDESIFEALRIAASSNVDVRVMIPNKPDHPFIYWATYSYASDLLKYGVKVYTYNNGFLHAKTIVVDDNIASCGTCNMDLRSFKLNFEVNAFIYDTNIAKSFKQIFLKDIENADEVTADIYKERTLTIKIKEALSRLFSPIL